MNHYTFDECVIGLKESFEIELTESAVDGFKSITGDLNPLHNDEDFAKAKGFEGKVAYGLLTSSFFSTLAGVYLPGENCLIEEVNWKFMRPVYADEKLVITGEVKERDECFKQLTLKTTIRRKSDDQLVVRGKMNVRVLEDS